MKQKMLVSDNKCLRLIKVNDKFVETEWCFKGHIGYVLKGEMTINFDGELKNFSKGDGLWIDKGENSQHKLIMPKNKKVKLLLIDEEV
ncbi:MAG: cupin domain-containing protein [Chitinophagales bacterium]|nr:cupin domain-containing protein [Bacteroidota bacterium]MCB9043793.1 cupin domain-containing protein [Chitinophagales bacterium]